MGSNCSPSTLVSSPVVSTSRCMLDINSCPRSWLLHAFLCSSFPISSNPKTFNFSRISLVLKTSSATFHTVVFLMDHKLLLVDVHSGRLCNRSSNAIDGLFGLPNHLQLPNRRISQSVFAVSYDDESRQQSKVLVGGRPIKRLLLSPYCRLAHSKTSWQGRFCRFCSRESQLEEEGLATEVGFHGRTVVGETERESQSNPEDRQSLAITVAISLLRFYKGEISPFLPRSCRYVPTCSEYAIQAYKQYGVLKGTVLTAWRLARCNPFGGSGYDPPRWFGEGKPPS